MTQNSRPIDLTRFVSNLDQNVYAIYNLPEEVIAVIFAYVSRSSASFRENLEKLLHDDELGVNASASGMATAYSAKAARFHEKWVVGYGHSSVAEHAVAHLGVEKISRLASAELELANTFNSFTEYSQRYQRPTRGDYYTPVELEQDGEAKTRYHELQSHAFATYEELLHGLIPYLQQTLRKKEGESDKGFLSRVEKIAFEDARYALTMATHTSLGLTGNGRALRDTLVRLLSSRYPEAHALARQLEGEISQVIPTLLKHVKPNDYLLQTRKAWESYPAPYPEQNRQGQAFAGPQARFTHLPDYDGALTQLVTHVLVGEKQLSYATAQAEAEKLSLVEKEQWVEASLSALRFFDNPLDAFRHLMYQMEFQLSEANWHQLLRHNRGTHFTYGEPTIELGYTIPPHVKTAGLQEPYQALIAHAEAVVSFLRERVPAVAPYCVTNAHHRQIIATASLWELYHLINLRTSPEAQWDIGQAFAQLAQQLEKKHPALIRYAKRRP